MSAHSLIGELSIDVLQDRLDLAGDIARDVSHFGLWEHPAYEQLAEIRQRSLDQALEHLRHVTPVRPSWRVGRPGCKGKPDKPNA